MPLRCAAAAAVVDHFNFVFQIIKRKKKQRGGNKHLKGETTLFTHFFFFCASDRKCESERDRNGKTNRTKRISKPNIQLMLMCVCRFIKILVWKICLTLFIESIYAYTTILIRSDSYQQKTKWAIWFCVLLSVKCY